ncbi:baseplate J/gp47 family protein [Klebsiella pneumoniae]|uniref:baseplate J/gp47 family protein n=1 Tax=Klebsiella pneumoniae TaxID=573 RepID=UPI001F4B75AD|nr:baseplate J/gp47 family protein [Klebsiella pneumoniae]HBW3346574.1 hypothetical protein [Klebsiella pneumoniae]
MTTTNVPQLEFTAAGVVLPAESEILDGVMADIDSAFGGGVNQQLNTPQGQLAQTLTAIIGDKNNQVAEMASQVDPLTSDGRWQDGIGRIYFMERIAASGTVVTGTCMGAVGTVIPAGSIAQDTSGYLYYSLVDAQIGPDGTVDTDFQCATTGPIACPPGALIKIYRAQIGWDRVTNNTAGTPGVDVESRADFEFRRSNSVAANARSLTEAIMGSVLGVTNVLDAYVYDNAEKDDIAYGATGYVISGNSVCVSVAGGEAADVAKAIWKKKSLGCSYTGNTSYTVQDTENYSPPYPEYRVTWLVPTATEVFFNVQISKNDALPNDIETLVQTAIINAFNGVDGGSRARICSIIYAGRYYAGVSAVDNNVNILSISLGWASDALKTSLSVGIDQRPTLSAKNITVELVDV